MATSSAGRMSPESGFARPRTGSGIFPNEAAGKQLVGSILLEPNDEGAVQRSRYMTLESIAPVGDGATVGLPTL